MGISGFDGREGRRQIRKAKTLFQDTQILQTSSSSRASVCVKAEHKIQSASGLLDMQLAQVPKMLLVLRKELVPTAFCVSFKLETDSKILLEKADMALKKYKMHAVVANELLSRKEEVVVVTSSGKITVRSGKTEAGADVENPLI